jgi:NADPH-dependent curcumin reductase CurA
MSTPSTAKTNHGWVVAEAATGVYSPDCLVWTHRPILAIPPGTVLVKTLYLSLDPTSRNWLKLEPHSQYLPIKVGDVMLGVAVGEVVQSATEHFAAGDLVTGMWGWEEYSIANPALLERITPSAEEPVESYLSVFSHVGRAAVMGLVEVGKLKSSDTVVVSGASGATGAIACQIAKAAGSRVIGIAGGRKKCEWLASEIPLDGVIDYKGGEVSRELSRLCPSGVDLFFDNVGGPILDAVLENMAVGCRIVICGAISQYNLADPKFAYGIRNLPLVLWRRSRIEGFVVVPNFKQVFPQLEACLHELFRKGRIRHRCHIVDGLQQAPTALGFLFEGKNDGKLMVKVL